MKRSGSRARPWTTGLTVPADAALMWSGFEPVRSITVVRDQRTVPNPEGLFCSHSLSAVASASGWTSEQPLRPVKLWLPNLKAEVAREHRMFENLQRDLVTRCARVGGNGVIDVSFTASRGRAGLTTYRMTGTAVRVAARSPGSGGFSTHLGSADFARLVGAGWMPVSVVTGLAIGVRHEPMSTFGNRLAAISRTVEMEAWTDVMLRTRTAAGDDLYRHVSELGASGALLESAELDEGLRKCPRHRGRDWIMRARFLGTAIVQFSERPPAPAGPRDIMTMLRLGGGGSGSGGGSGGGGGGTAA